MPELTKCSDIVYVVLMDGCWRAEAAAAFGSTLAGASWVKAWLLWLLGGALGASVGLSSPPSG
jgi:hypothetical protein